MSLLRLFLFVLVSLSAMPAAMPAAGDVTLSQDGNNAILSNGLVTVMVNTPSATVLSVKYKGNEFVSSTGRHKTIYFSRDGGKAYERLSGCVFSVTARTPDMVDISCKSVFSPESGDRAPWDVDVHFVVRRGVPGFYFYVVTSHPPSYPDLNVGEWRIVWSTPEVNGQHLLEKIYVDAARHWEMPSPEDMRKAVAVPGAPMEITRVTTGLWKDRYECKYMYNARYREIGCWGYASDKNNLGGWWVLGGHDFFNDGPTKQDLSASVGAGLVHLNRNHYNSPSFRIKKGEDWTKFYGPILFYCNDKTGANACWLDAQARTRIEEAAWPYEWVRHPAYPPASGRGSVQGKLVIRDPLKPDLTAANAWVGIAKPSSDPKDNWQFQADAYQYWVQAGADGSFRIPHIRPGTYALYAFTKGAVGEYYQDGITVQAGRATALGDITWTVPHKGSKIAWEIGMPDRTATEFKFGKEFFLPMQFVRLPRELPNPLEYDTAKGDWANTWAYAQSTSRDARGQSVPAKWRIRFNLPEVPTGPATLTVAVAGADFTRLFVYVNDETKALCRLNPKVQGGNAFIREGGHAKYCVEYVQIPASRLKAGENVITLEQTNPSGHVMYDYLNLELP